MATHGEFVPALIVVDMQEDFCPPNGSLAVPGGRELAPLINELLKLPFAFKVATKDFHPKEHVSFDTCNEAPNNKAFVSLVSVVNPANPSETKNTMIWPVHCVQGTKGAEIIPEIDTSKLDAIVEKGQDKRFEMYSGFANMFGSKVGANVDLALLLKDKGITHVYTVGLTGDCCVRYTALDACREGFKTVVIQDATRSADEGEKGWGEAVKEFQDVGVAIVQSSGPELLEVKNLR